jgi:hypothetical protein
MPKITKGSEFQHQWPSIPNVISESSITDICDLLEKDSIVSVTEKLDGCNVSISSQGYVATRRQIICEDISKTDLNKLKLQGVSLAHLKQILFKLKEAQEDIKTKLELSDFELLIYGELILKGTATSTVDCYSYKTRGIRTGRLHAFGLGFNFNQDLTECEKKTFKEKASELVGRFDIETRSPSKFFIVPFNSRLCQFFQDRLFRTVPYLCDNSIKTVLSDKKLSDELIQKRYEGLCLSVYDRMFKWKPKQLGGKSSHLSVFPILRLKDNGHMTGVLKSLEDFYSKTSLTERKTELNSHLFSQLVRSASTKYPSLLDSLYSLGADWRSGVAEINLNYGELIRSEILKDLVELGFKIDSDIVKNVEGRLKSFIDFRIKSFITSKIEEEIKSQFDDSWCFLSD